MSKDYKVKEIPVSLEFSQGAEGLVHSSEGSPFGAIIHKSKGIINILRKEITVQLFADWAPFQSKGSAKKANGKPSMTKSPPLLEICAVLYGPAALSDTVGSFLTRCHIYLQDPANCNLNVPYFNPQCLSREDCRIIYTLDLGNCSDMESSAFGISANPIDLFADSALQETLADSETPDTLSTELYPHQKQALTFMTQRERGWATDGHHKDIWKREIDEQGQIWYRNFITGLKQTNAPRPFRGGLLIDAPGLGKSLSILALIVLDPASREQHTSENVSTFATLVIVPKSCKPGDPMKWSQLLTRIVIQLWKDELEKSALFCEVQG